MAMRDGIDVYNSSIAYIWRAVMDFELVAVRVWR